MIANSQWIYADEITGFASMVFWEHLEMRTRQPML